MSRKINYISISPFHDRLFEIVGGDIQGWARRLGVTPATISNRWLRGSYPTADKLIKISEHLNIDYNWLITGKATQGACTIPPGFEEFCTMLKDILEQNTDDQIKSALRTNLVAFQNSAEKDRKAMEKNKQIAEMAKKVDYLMQLYESKIQSDI